MSWSDDVRRANETLDWIEQRQGPLPEAGYARIQTTVGQVRAMAEGQDDARIAEIRARYAGLEKLLEDTTGQWDRSQLLPMVSELAGAAKTIPYLLERLDALTAERDLLRVERDIARRVEQESSAAADAWQAEAVKVRGERDDALARLAAAEAARDAAEQIIADVQFDLINCHQQNACAHIQDALMIVNRHGAVLAGSREQAGEGA